MATRKTPPPPRSWDVDMLLVLGAKEGDKTKHLKAIPVLILERWVQNEREENVANHVYTRDIANRLESSGLVIGPLKGKNTSTLLSALTVIQRSRNLTRPPLIEYQGDGRSWVNLPHYEPLLQEYRQKYHELYPEDYQKLFLVGEPVWESSDSINIQAKPKMTAKPIIAEPEAQNEIHNILVGQLA